MVDKLTNSPTDVTRSILSDGVITDIDQFGQVEQDDQIKIKLTPRELQKIFDEFIIQKCTPYARARMT